MVEVCGEDNVEEDVCCVGSLMWSGEAIIGEERGFEIKNERKKMKFVGW